MKIDKKTILDKLQNFLLFVRKYMVFIFLIFILVIFGFFVQRINQYNRIEPQDNAVDDKLKTVSIPRIDEDVINKIKDLQSQNIQVQTLFDQARNNPFSE